MLQINLTQISDLFPNHLCLAIPPETQTEVWQNLDKYTNEVARDRAYLNQLCLTLLLNHLKQEFEDCEVTEIPTIQDWHTIWDVVNGFAIAVGQTPFVFIPQETDDLENIIIPAEWLEIPDWVGAYYLPVQVNLDDEESWLRVWGFTTYETVKGTAYDSIQNNYICPRQDLVENLNTLWAMQEVSPVPQPQVSSLPTLPSTTLQKQLEAFSEVTRYSPRLTADFTAWKTLLSQPQWRQKLHQKRLQQMSIKTAVQKIPIQLSEWFQNAAETLEQGWQNLESVFDAAPVSFARHKQLELLNDEAVSVMVRSLQYSCSEKEKARAAYTLGLLGSQSVYPDVIDALVQLLQETQDEETRTQAALSLGKLQPNHPLSGRQRAKVLDLGIQLEGRKFALIASVVPRPDRRTGISIEVKTLDTRNTLPPNLTLRILSAAGETRLESVVRQDENGQGKDQTIGQRFSIKTGKLFRVQVLLGDACFTEELIA
jgi:hypothetical protein